jgi:hypothetical protein
MGGTNRQQGDLISLLKKFMGYTDRNRLIYRQTDRQTDTQEGDLIGLLLFFQNKDSRLMSLMMAS